MKGSCPKVQIVGGGLAGSEAAWVLARNGFLVDLYEMRPTKNTPAHKTSNLSELVCSNSFRSNSPLKPVGILKQEMSQLHSLVMEASKLFRLPAGDALAVDRILFSNYITKKIEQSPFIQIHREEVTDLEKLFQKGPVIIASGPLTSSKLSDALRSYIGEEQLYFYDAISPIVDSDTLDYSKIFAASRYGKGEGADYLNCSMTKDEYFRFLHHVRKAERVVLKAFEKEIFFEGCLPIEVMADRGDLTLAYGPMKPVGLMDPKTGREPFAIVQLRKENQAGTAYNLVGFQTKLTYPEQKRIFRMIPGLEKAEFFRLGSIHRNTYIHSPKILNSKFQLKKDPRIFFAGQITGTEGYIESASLGLWVGIIWMHEFHGKRLENPPPTTALGAMIRYLTTENHHDFQPMNINYGIFEGLCEGKKRYKRFERNLAYSTRAKQDFLKWLKVNGFLIKKTFNANSHLPIENAL